MAIKVNYLDNGIGIELIASGVVTGQEIIEANKKIYNEENLKKLKYKIIDRTHCAKYQVYAEEVQTIAEMDNSASEENPHITIAVIAPTTLQFGMTKMWQAYLQKDRLVTKIFQDRKSADKWIKSQLEINKHTY